jgi:hypothetical protein
VEFSGEVGMKFLLATVAAVTSLLTISGQNLCDDSYATHCPEESGWSVGDCLKKQEDSSSLGAACESFIALHDACKVCD